MPDGFTILGIEIKFYGLIIAISFILGLLLVQYLTNKKGYNKDLPFDLLLIVFPLAIVGARLYYIAFSGRSWTLMQMISLQDGGLAIYGGVIASLLGIIIYARIKNIQTIKLTDLAVPALILGQALGRWGNFFNQEAYGYEVTNSQLQWFPYAVFIEMENAWHMATFFYESMWNLMGFAIILVMFLKIDKKGLVTSFYLIFYGIGRAFIEGLRTDSLYIGANIRVSQALSIAMVIVGIGMFIYYYRKQNYNYKSPKS